MTAPQGRDRITAEDVAETHLAFLSLSVSTIAAILNDPAIRRLVVRKCVEAMDYEAIDGLSTALDAGHGRDDSLRGDKDAIISALCPERTPR